MTMSNETNIFVLSFLVFIYVPSVFCLLVVDVWDTRNMVADFQDAGCIISPSLHIFGAAGRGTGLSFAAGLIVQPFKLSSDSY